MTQDTDIPREPVLLGYTSTGLLPDVGLHRRGHLFCQQSSYVHLWLSVPFLLAAVVVPFLPLGAYARWVFMGFFLFTAASAAVPFFFRNHFGQSIIIDPQRRTVRIRERETEQTIAWPEVVALQLCRQDKPCAAYQLNLVWRRTDGALKRHCLATHVVKRFVVRLTRRYESALPFKVIDQIGDARPA